MDAVDGKTPPIFWLPNVFAAPRQGRLGPNFPSRCKRGAIPLPREGLGGVRPGVLSSVLRRSRSNRRCWSGGRRRSRLLKRVAAEQGLQLFPQLEIVLIAEANQDYLAQHKAGEPYYGYYSQDPHPPRGESAGRCL